MYTTCGRIVNLEYDSSLMGIMTIELECETPINELNVDQYF